MTGWTQETRARLEEDTLHRPGCPLAHAPNRISSCVCGKGIDAALSEIDRLTACVEALEGAKDVAALAVECWQDLLDRDDRTSPAEYPEMALITYEELEGYLTFAALTPSGEEPAGRWEMPNPAEPSQTPERGSDWKIKREP